MIFPCPKAQDFAAAIPPAGWEVVAQVDNNLGLQSSTSLVATTNVPSSQPNPAQYSLVSTGISQDYRTQLEAIAKGGASPVGWATSGKDLDFKSFRESLISIAEHHKTKLTVPKTYLESQSNFTLTDRIALREIQNVLKVPQTGLLDAATAVALLKEFEQK